MLLTLAGRVPDEKKPHCTKHAEPDQYKYNKLYCIVLHHTVLQCIVLHKISDLKKHIVDWRLDLEAERVGGIVLVENEFVIDAEVRQCGDSRLILRRQLVTISFSIQLLSQFFQLLPTVFTPSPLLLLLLLLLLFNGHFSW